MKKLFTLFIILASFFSARAAVHTIQVADFAFTPSTVNAVCGDTLLWIWVSGSHTTTSTSIPACANGWNAPINSSVGSFMYVLACAGTYSYECTIHTSMTGTINVSCVTGTEETTRLVSTAFPNPFTNRITVQTGGSDHIVLTDILGRELKTADIPASQTTLTMFVTLPRGVYVLRFYTEGRLTDVRKLVRN